MPKRSQPTDAEPEHRRAADRAFVQKSVEAPRSSDGWQLAHKRAGTSQLLAAYLEARMSVLFA